MSRDSIYSRVHFSHARQVEFMEDWRNYHVPFDDIDTAQLNQASVNIFPQFLLEEEEDGAIPLNSAAFSSKVNKSKNLLRQPIWTDLGTEQLRADAKSTRLPDETILKSLHSAVGEESLTNFLSNGYNNEQSVLANDNYNVSDSWSNVTSEYPINHTFSNRLRSTSGNRSSEMQHLHTPQLGRVRQASSERYQTPIGRIVR
ncbi:Apc13p protein [Candidozyma auris]|uniref:Uncharacterized protein n=1 Tax=Candidozyma auris TaxID=498019 RepID=A0A2H0ZNK2_CANAR|nr:hypothetical protein B9J08_003781 [[Candida] auris]PIS54153.1 hypothetical protein CJI97_003853 [[Candida] auris]